MGIKDIETWQDKFSARDKTKINPWIVALVFVLSFPIVFGIGLLLSAQETSDVVVNYDIQPTASYKYVDASINDPYLTPDSETLTVTYTNTSDCDLDYGTFFKVEKYDPDADTWTMVEYRRNIGFTAAAYLLPAHENVEVFYDMTIFAEPLTYGNYRIITEVADYAPCMEFLVDSSKK